MPDDALRSELLRELRVLRRGPGLVSMCQPSDLFRKVLFFGSPVVTVGPFGVP